MNYNVNLHPDKLHRPKYYPAPVSSRIGYASPSDSVVFFFGDILNQTPLPRACANGLGSKYRFGSSKTHAYFFQ